MLDIAPARTDVKAVLNYARDRTDGGVFSNLDPKRTDQPLLPHTVEIRDARRLPVPPSLDREGFVRLHDPVAGANWRDTPWREEVYLPTQMALLRRLTGAGHVAAMHNLALIRDTGDERHSPAAEFVHMDYTLQSALPFLERTVDAETRRRLPRVKVFNIWRVITPPPQDTPLALCDQRSIDTADGVVGRAVEPHYPDGIPYTTSVHNPGQRWWWFPDLTPDDVIIFKGYDNAPAEPLGCLHSAFHMPERPAGAVPRASVELRIFALFEA